MENEIMEREVSYFCTETITVGDAVLTCQLNEAHNQHSASRKGFTILWTSFDPPIEFTS